MHSRPIWNISTSPGRWLELWRYKIVEFIRSGSWRLVTVSGRSGGPLTRRCHRQRRGDSRGVPLHRQRGAGAWSLQRRGGGGLGAERAPDGSGDEGHLLGLLITKFTGDRSLEVRPSLVKSSETSLQRLGVIRHSWHIFVILLLLESSEVVLDQERGVELANSNFFFQGGSDDLNLDRGGGKGGD